MSYRPKPTVWALAVVVGVAVTWWFLNRTSPAQRLSSEAAFRQSYLDAVEGKPKPGRTKCQDCHVDNEGLSPKVWSELIDRASLSRDEWAEAIPLAARCGLCHVVPDPILLRQQSWQEVLWRMEQLMTLRKIPILTPEERQDVLHFYLTFSPVLLPHLAPDPAPTPSSTSFEPFVLGNPKGPDRHRLPVVGHVQIVDLDRDGLPDVLVSDTGQSKVTWIHRVGPEWREEPLAALPYPTHTQLIPGSRSGSWDIVVACQRVLAPTDELVGSVVVLVNDGNQHFTPRTILRDIPRVADVEPGDFDGDGDIDFVVGAFGFINQGEVGWLENRGNGNYEYHLIVKRAGAIHVPTADLNADGRLDFVALFAQEHEQVSAFINDGNGRFQEHVLFKAATPSFGSSGIQLVDLDRDGDLDILYTNGDNMDLPTMVPRPYHGVQWLENKGNLRFVWHDIMRFYGAYSAVAADLDRDGYLDIVVTSVFNDWLDPNRASIIWLENDGQQHFTPHGIARSPINLISADVADVDLDGKPDIVTCAFNLFPPLPFERTGRITFWKNRLPDRRAARH